MRRSRTSQPSQYGHWTTSRPHRSARPGTSGRWSVSPVVTISRRAVNVVPSSVVAVKWPAWPPRSVTGGVDDADVVPVQIGPPVLQVVERGGVVAAEHAVHVRGGCVAGSAVVEDDDAATGTAQHLSLIHI